MKKLTLKEFVDFIKSSTKAVETERFFISEHNRSTFKIEVESAQEIIFLDLPQENSYDVLFKTLKEEFSERLKISRSLSADMWGKYHVAMAIDNKVFVLFKYHLSEGQEWLKKYCKGSW